MIFYSGHGIWKAYVAFRRNILIVAIVEASVTVLVALMVAGRRFAGSVIFLDYLESTIVAATPPLRYFISL